MCIVFYFLCYIKLYRYIKLLAKGKRQNTYQKDEKEHFKYDL